MPCIKIPTRKIFAASHVVKIKVAYNSPSESKISHAGMPNGMRAIITIGEVNGMTEVQNAKGELGSLKTDIITMIERMIGSIIMVLYC